MVAGVDEVCGPTGIVASRGTSSSSSSASLSDPSTSSSSAEAAPTAPTPRRGRCAFVSTPSIYFALPPSERSSGLHRVLDYDSASFGRDKGFVFYDFNKPSDVPQEIVGAFDLVVIDPPFITEEVWRKYGETARLLLSPGGHALCTTVAENVGLLQELFPNLRRMAFQPSIPHLVYQYDLYCTWDSAVFGKKNPEIPD
jgi:hypothetical protein